MPPKHVPKMKCCVPLCRSTDDNCRITVDSPERITFNRFPATPEQRVAWLEVLGLTESDLPPDAVVCSEHFKRNDFTVMSDGTVKLMENSIPLQFCMICLASGNSKMYPMNQNYLQKAYTTMTGIAVSYIRDKTNILPRLCAECAQRLVNCDGLRDKSLRAYKSLIQILKNDKVLTLHNLKSVNRVRKQLTSNLLKHTFGADYYDLYVKYNEEGIKIHVKEKYNCDIEENTKIKRKKCDNSEKVAKEFHVESLNESDDFQNDVLTTFDINNDDNSNCDNINNDDSTNRDISNFCLNDNVIQVISKDFDDNDEDIINPDVTNVTNNVFMISNSDDKLKPVEDHLKHGIDDDVENGCGDTINEHNNIFLKKKYGKVNRLVGNKSGNKRVILKKAIFVKESRANILNNDLIPGTNKANENVQFPKVLDIINPDVTDVTNNGFMISNSDDKVKSIEEIIKHVIDDDVENGCDDTINELNNVSLKNKIVKLNRLKNENKSGNRVILKNAIFVKESRPNILNNDLIPGTNKPNENVQFPKVLDIINPDVNNVTNNGFMISNSDDKLKSVEGQIKHGIDDDVENGCDDTINEHNNVFLKKKYVKVNRLVGNKSGNKRVILKNAICVKESRPNILNNDLIPGTNKANENVQFPKVLDIINPDVTDVTNNGFMISNSDDKVKSIEEIIKHVIDDDVENGCDDTINELNNVSLKNKIVKLNRLKNGNKSGNRVILNKEIINPDVTNVTNNVFMISNSDDEVKSVEEIIKQVIDDDAENGCDDTINELNNVSLKNKIVKLNRLKNGNMSGNKRVILKNTIFVKESRANILNNDLIPGTNKPNENVQFPKVLDIINPDVTNVTNNGFMISNSDDEVKSVEEIIKQVIDDDVENGCDDTINELNNVSLKNKIVKLNRLKNGNKSGNKRVILKNTIFVKESRPNILNNDLIPITDKANENVQFPKVFYSKVYCKNINNAQTIEKNVEGSTEHVILNNRLLGVFKENKINKNDRHLSSISKIVKTRILKTKKRILFDKLVEKSNKNDRQLSSTNKVVKTRVPKTKKKPNLFDKLVEKSNKNDRELSSTNEVVETHVPKRQKPNLNGKLFTKTILTYEEQLADMQKRKDAENYSTYPYKCDICFTGRLSLFTYNRHMAKHTDKYGKLECDICGFRYKSRPPLTRHLREHTERYSCKRCNFVTGNRSLVIMHARWHRGVAFKCPHCELKFRKLSSYFTHLRLKHASRFACPLCGFCFVSENGVKTHISFSHPFESLQNLSGPSCERCDIRFASEDAYNTHMSVSSKHIIPGFVLRNQATEMYNRRRNGKSRAPQNRGTEVKIKLCEVCGKELKSVTLFNRHMNVHAGVTPYQCELCSKSYTSKVSLRSHQLISHGERARYPCAVCHRDFSNYSNRHRHMLTHDPSKRPSYTCHICSKSFSTKVGKDEHVVHVHQQVPRPKRDRARERARARRHGGASDASARDTADANMAS